MNKISDWFSDRPAKWWLALGFMLVLAIVFLPITLGVSLVIGVIKSIEIVFD